MIRHRTSGISLERISQNLSASGLGAWYGTASFGRTILTISTPLLGEAPGAGAPTVQKTMSGGDCSPILRIPGNGRLSAVW